MNSSDLPYIVDMQVKRLSKITLCSYADILLAAKTLLPLSRDFRGSSLIHLSLFLEQVVKQASMSGISASGVALELSDLARMSKLTPHAIITCRMKFMLIIGRIKYNFKTIFGFIPWIDYRTRKWFKD